MSDDQHEHPDDKAFAARVKELMDAEAESPDTSVRSKRNQVRQAALDEMPAAKPGLFGFGSFSWGPLSAIVIVICFSVMFWFFDLTLIEELPEEPATRAEEEMSADDLAMLLSLDEQASAQESYRRFQNLPPEQRQQMRERWEGMSPEEREAARSRMQERRQNSGEPAGRRPPPPERETN